MSMGLSRYHDAEMRDSQADARARADLDALRGQLHALREEMNVVREKLGDKPQARSSGNSSSSSCATTGSSNDSGGSNIRSEEDLVLAVLTQGAGSRCTSITTSTIISSAAVTSAAATAPASNSEAASSASLNCDQPGSRSDAGNASTLSPLTQDASFTKQVASRYRSSSASASSRSSVDFIGSSVDIIGSSSRLQADRALGNVQAKLMDLLPLLFGVPLAGE